jgi:hypothetical protein
VCTGVVKVRREVGKESRSKREGLISLGLYKENKLLD